jgi:hypothetical protein
MKTAGSYNIKTANITKASPFVTLLTLNVVGVPSSGGKETEVNSNNLCISIPNFSLS